MFCILTSIVYMGVDPGGTRGTSPPEFGVGGTLVQIVPLRFVSYRYKKERTVAFKIRQNSFSDPAGGAHDAPPDPIVGCRGDTPPHTLPHSAPIHLRLLSCVPPEFQPDLRQAARPTIVGRRDLVFLPLPFLKIRRSTSQLA